METEESFWNGNCDTVHCSNKGQWPIPDKCSSEDQCKGTGHCIWILLVLAQPFSLGILFTFFSLKCWILAAWGVKFDASHWTFYYDPSGFQSSNNHPGNGRLAWLSWAVWHTIDCCGILMIIALNEWFSLWRSIYYFLFLCYHHVMFDISISLNFIFERIFIQSETWDFGDQMGNCFHIDIPDSNYKLCCTCCINSSGLCNAIFSLKI